MFARLADLVVRRRVAVLVVTAVLLVVAAVIGGGVAGRLVSGGFDDPASESSRAARLIEAEFGVAEPNLVLLVTASAGTVDDPAAARAGQAVAAQLAAEPDVAEVLSYWGLGNAPPLRSEDGASALVLARITGDDDAVEERVGELSEAFTRTGDPISVGVGGAAEVYRQIGEQVEQDLVRAELIAFPFTLLLLVAVFGGLVAAGLPLLVGLLAIMGALLVLFLVSLATDVSIFALNLTTALGLGLAIDYSLFIVSRFREELRLGRDPHDAVRRTVMTAGRTVVFSAVTVAISLTALLVFPLVFLRSFAYAGVGVALMAATAAAVTLPALLAVLGHRVDALTLWRRNPEPVGEGFWHNVATFVMRRPLPIAAVIVLLLLLLGTPFLRVSWGMADDRALPAGVSSREVQDAIRDGFTSNEAGALEVVVTGTGDPVNRLGEIDAHAAELSSLAGVARVDALTGSYVAGAKVADLEAVTGRFQGEDGTWFSVVPAVEPLSSEGEALARAVRHADTTLGDTLVTGASAELVDSKAGVFGRAPLALAWIAVATFVLLFLMFGSVLVPLKALVINVLSLTATFGALVWIFQDGNLSGLLGFTPTGTIETTMPILMFCVAFGLSMDYEVFLLSRIKEEHDHGADNVTSVALGLERTGRIVTAAAVLISVVFLAFATSGITFMKMFGLGLALAVLMDAFVIRATLVPAFMRLAGDANWWAPPWLRRIHERFGISEGGGDQREDDGMTSEPARMPVDVR